MQSSLQFWVILQSMTTSEITFMQLLEKHTQLRDNKWYWDLQVLTFQQTGWFNVANSRYLSVISCSNLMYTITTTCLYARSFNHVLLQILHLHQNTTETVTTVIRTSSSASVEWPRDTCFNSICKMVNITFVSYPLRDFTGNIKCSLLLGLYCYSNSVPVTLQLE